MSDYSDIWEEYRYFARKRQLIYPNSVMAYMMLFSTGERQLLKARRIVIGKFCEPYCWTRKQ